MKSRMLTTLVTVLVTASLVILMGPTRSATPVLGAGANKIGISAATNTLINLNQQPNANSSTSYQLASATFSTSTTEDLIMNFSTECGIYTAVGGKNNNTTSIALPVTTSSAASVLATFPHRKLALLVAGHQPLKILNTIALNILRS